MGHVAAKSYRSLQKRLDMMPIGAPAHRAFVEMLEELYTPEECRVAAGIPLKLARLPEIAKNAGLPESHTEAVLDGLADKGLVVDLPRINKPTLYFLNPTVVGFFEFTMMRVREDVDQRRVAELMRHYMFQDPKQAFIGMMTRGETFIARPLIHETTLEPEAYSEVLDWESATELIDRAGFWSEAICHCRHVALHAGKRCDYPLEHCLAIGRSARWLVRRNLAKEISRERAFEILEYAREHGAVQMADNVKNQPSFICNCCKCCCEMMEAMRALPDGAKVVSSNFVAVLDTEACNGCGNCAKACPIDVIDMVPAAPSELAPKRKKRAQLDADRCLGCGVCYQACKFSSVRMRRTERRVYTPADRMERMALQAIEQGKLQHLIFNDPKRLTHRALGTLLGVLVKLPPAKQALANRELKSRFVAALLS
jgi:Fe-S-cluster-containing hydrogenase component 2